MDIRNRIVAPIMWVPTYYDRRCYTESLFERLLIFDNYVLESNFLEEIPFFLKLFGFQKTLNLLNCESLSIHYDGIQFLFRDADEFSNNRYRITRRNLDKEENILNSINKIEKYCDNSLDFEVLKETLKRKILKYNNAPHDLIYKQTADDLNHNYQLVRRILSILLSRHPNIASIINSIVFDIKADDNGEIIIDSNLQEILKCSDKFRWKLWEKVIVSIARINIRFLQMNHYEALSGASKIDIPMFDAKIGALKDRLSENTKVEQFRRINSLGKFPNFEKAIENNDMNIDSFINILKTDEIIEFREILWDLENFSDEQIKARIKGLNAKAKSLFASNWFKSFKWFTISAIGIVEPIGGIALAGADQFIVDKILPKKGAWTFIRNVYPEIYKD